MGIHSDINLRMKHNYEEVAKYRLTRRTPVAIRIDGKAFRTFTKDFVKPFDDIMRDSMNETMKYLCENIQGCVFGYTQSDEITLILIDYENLTSDAWFDYEVQKLCSISASMATFRFNRVFNHFVAIEQSEMVESKPEYQAHVLACDRGAMFDSRCFNIPKEEVCNLIYSRQIDCIRNAIQMLGRTYFSANELHKRTIEDIKVMLKDEKQIDWQTYENKYIRGVACRRVGTTSENPMFSEEVPYITDTKERSKFVLDYDIPLFKGENRSYIEDLILV